MPETNEKDVSIIIVNYKSWKHLKECLDALTALLQKKTSHLRLLIIDNKSNDGKLKEFSEKYTLSFQVYRKFW